MRVKFDKCLFSSSIYMGTEAHSRGNSNSYKVTGLALLPGSNQKFIIFSLYLIYNQSVAVT